MKNLAAQIKCPNCQTMVSFASSSGAVQNREGLWWIGICSRCDVAVLILGAGERVIPASKVADPRIPAIHRRYLDEARACLPKSANGAVSVAGKALDSFIKSLTGAPQEGTLGALLRWCAQNKRLPDELIALAKTTTAVRNDGAHHNDNDPTPREAEQTIEVIEFILTFYFGHMQAATVLSLTHPKAIALNRR